nr:SNU13 snRNP subunit [Cryptomonas sp.]
MSYIVKKDILSPYYAFMELINPKAYPIADNDFSIQILDLIELAKEFKQIKKGANESTKTLNRGTAELIIVAADTDPIEIVLHLPLLCEDKHIPYIFIRSKQALGKACGVSRPVIACSLISGINLRLNEQIKKIRTRAEKLIN